MEVVGCDFELLPDVTNASQLLKSIKEQDLNKFLYEIFWHVLGTNLKVEDLIQLLKDYDKKPQHFDSTLADVCWYIGLEISHAEKEEEKNLSPEFKTLCELVRDLALNGVVSTEIFLERLELNVIEGAQLGDKKVLERKLKKVNTNNNFRQKKYNLLSEESEGFGKLITELQNISNENVNTRIRNIQSLIGYFHLDPNRCFDLILDAFEIDPANDAFLQLITLFRASNLKHLVGFKLQMYHPKEDEDSGNEKEFKETPKSLFRLVAVLLKRNVLTLDEIYPHLYPTDETIVKNNSAKLHAMKVRTRKIGVVSLKTRSVEERAKEKEAQEAELKARLAKERQQALENQKYGLIAGMIELGAWNQAKALRERLQHAGADEEILEHPYVCEASLSLLGSTIEPFYDSIAINNKFRLHVKKASDTSDIADKEEVIKTLKRFDSKELDTIEPFHNFKDFLGKVGPIIEFIGHKLSLDVLLMCKVCRLMRVYIEAEKSVPMKLQSLIAGTILPSLSLLPTSNVNVAEEVWSVVWKCGYAIRFKLYEIWRSSQYETVPNLSYKRALVKYETKQVLKRVAKEAEVMRLAGRRFAKLAHNNPIVAFSALLDNVKSYDNLIPIVVDSLKFVTSFGLDVLAYLIIIYLSGKNNGLAAVMKIKPDGTSHTNWMQSLCKFTGHFYQKNPHVELTGLLLYLVGQLRENKPHDLLMLEEIVSNMAGLGIVEDFSDSTLRGMGGGPTLRKRTRASSNQGRSNLKLSSEYLNRALQQSQVTMPLMILIAQQRIHSLFYTSKSKDEQHLKLLGHSFDTCTSALIQLNEFIAMHLPIEEYEKLMLLPSDLCSKYHIEPVIAFHLVNPMIRSAQHKVLVAEKEVTVAQKKAKLAKGDPELKKAEEGAVKTLNELQTSHWIIGSDALVNNSKRTIPKDSDVWEYMTYELYSLFWSLSLYDVLVPRAQYDSEINHLQTKQQRIEKGEEMKENSRKQRESTLKACISDIDALKKELDSQLLNHQNIIRKIKQMKEKILPKAENTDAFIQKFIQICLLPRVVFSPEDALYCARFLKLVLFTSPQDFPPEKFMTNIMHMCSSLLFSCTEGEAMALGMFLANVLKEQKDIKYEVFEEGFSEMVCRAIKKHTRVTFMILNKTVSVFPGWVETADKLKTSISEFKESNRPDIQMMAKRYANTLDKQLRTGNLKYLNPPPKKTKSKPIKKSSSVPAKSTQSKPLPRKGTGKRLLDGAEEDGEISEASTKRARLETNRPGSSNSNKNQGGRSVSSNQATTKRARVETNRPSSENSNKSQGGRNGLSNQASTKRARVETNRPNASNSNKSQGGRNVPSNQDNRSRDSQGKQDDKSRGSQPKQEEKSRGSQANQTDRSRAPQVKQDDRSRGSQPKQEEKTRGSQANQADRSRAPQVKQDDRSRGSQPKQEEKTRGSQANQADRSRTPQAKQDDKSRGSQTKQDDRSRGGRFRGNRDRRDDKGRESDHERSRDRDRDNRGGVNNRDRYGNRGQRDNRNERTTSDNRRQGGRYRRNR